MALYGRLLHVKSVGRPKKSPMLFECLLCTDKFTAEDVHKKLYFVSTGICRDCYKVAVNTHPKIWCFGKLPKQKLPGFNAQKLSCRLLCPDRSVCKMFIAKQTKEK